MQHGLLGSLSLVGVSGLIIIIAIVVVLIASVSVNLVIRARYTSLARDIDDHKRADLPLSHRVLNRVLEDAREAKRQGGPDASPQTIIEHHFQQDLGPLLLGERFVRASVGLSIILGLVGTFYGLTLSIGQLVSLVSGDASSVVNVTDAVTSGLAQSLSGMAVAFSTSLFGIAAAIVLTLFNIFSNLTDRRTAVMVSLEAHLDRLLAGEAWAGPAAPGGEAARLEHMVQSFVHGVAALQHSVAQFDASLQGFAATTRDFHEFNLHLKDNVQRMSLTFGDLSETVRGHVVALRGHGR